MFQGFDTFPSLSTQALQVHFYLSRGGAVPSDLTIASHREDLVGEALDVLQKKHDIKRDEIYIQTKCPFDLLQ